MKHQQPRKKIIDKFVQNAQTVGTRYLYCRKQQKMIKYLQSTLTTLKKAYGEMFGGKLMDTFIDKIAQKFNAQEIIKANSEAESKENQRLRTQLDEYDSRIQEIRKLNLKNQEIAEQLQQMLDSDKTADAETIDALHKECVKVYRNVQAVVEDGFTAQKTVIAQQNTLMTEQTAAIGAQNAQIKKRVSGVKVMMIITMILTAGNLGVLICHILDII